MNAEVAKQLVKAREAVRKKYRSLKSDMAQSQFQLEKGYKPITEPLQKLLSTIKTDVSIKKDPADYKTETPTFTPKRSPANTYNKYLPTLPMATPSFLEDTFQYDQSINDDDNEDDNEQDSTDLINQEVEKSRIYMQELPSTKAYQEYLEAYDPLPRQYIDMTVRATDRETDHVYGIKHNPELEKFKIGGSDLEIEGKDVKVGGVTYPGTPGLYELLFMKQPTGYNEDDLDQYMDILNRSNAYRVKFNPDERIHGSKHEKYRHIIRPYLIKKGILKAATSALSKPFPKPPPPRLLQRTQSLEYHTKGGLLNLSNNKVDFVYYNDPNELINRLRLLIASQLAGNTGLHNEILSILEELREAKIIK